MNTDFIHTADAEVIRGASADNSVRLETSASAESTGKKATT